MYRIVRGWGMRHVFKYEVRRDDLARAASRALGAIKNVVLGSAVLIVEDDDTPANVVANTMFDVDGYTADWISQFDLDTLAAKY